MASDVTVDALLNASSPTFKIPHYADKKKPENRLRQMPTTSTTGNRVLQNIIIKNRFIATAIKQTLALADLRKRFTWGDCFWV